MNITIIYEIHTRSSIPGAVGTMAKNIIEDSRKDVREGEGNRVDVDCDVTGSSYIGRQTWKWHEVN